MCSHLCLGISKGLFPACVPVKMLKALLDTTYYSNKLNTIKYIFQEIGYNPEMIDTIQKKSKQNTSDQHHSEQLHKTAKNTSHQTCHTNILHTNKSLKHSEN